MSLIHFSVSATLIPCMFVSFQFTKHCIPFKTSSSGIGLFCVVYYLISYKILMWSTSCSQGTSKFLIGCFLVGFQNNLGYILSFLSISSCLALRNAILLAFVTLLYVFYFVAFYTSCALIHSTLTF